MSTENSYQFKASTSKVLQIITHSLYQNSEVYLRELISNASDALNKVRIKQLQSENILDPAAPLEIRLIADKERNTLTVSDTGIGMTKSELQENLGTIAQSGTEQFLQALDEGGDATELIGMFGVGFYSAFLVASKVEVITRGVSPQSKAWKWSSDGEDSFTIEPAEKESRGTDIILHLKEEDEKYLNNWELRTLVRRYSNYIQFPIKAKKTDPKEDEDEWETLNDQVALWRKNPKEVTEEEYEGFFRSLSMGGTPLATIHLRVETPIEFYAIIYIPRFKTQNFMAQQDEWGLNIYNRKVLINESNKEMLPEWARFVVGVVDGENLKLNVSREVLQENSTKRAIQKHLAKKILDKLEEMADEFGKEITVESEEEDGEPETRTNEDYMDFWREFGPFLKEGIAQDSQYKDRLTELLRFDSTAEEGKLGGRSLTDYVINMKPDQDKIYYLTGLELDMLKKSPHLEYYKKEGVEVLLLGEPIDSFLMMHLNEYQEKPFFLIDEEETEEEEEKSEETEDEEDDSPKEKTGPLAPLLTRAVTVLGTKVSDVKTSERLVGAVASLVTPKGGMNSNLQRAMRIMQAQQGGAGLGNMGMMGKVLTLNPNHELVQRLNSLVENTPEDERIDMMILQIHDQARILEGDVPDFAEMLSRMENIMKFAVDE